MRGNFLSNSTRVKDTDWVWRGGISFNSLRSALAAAAAAAAAAAMSHSDLWLLKAVKFRVGVRRPTEFVHPKEKKTITKFYFFTAPVFLGAFHFAPTSRFFPPIFFWNNFWLTPERAPYQVDFWFPYFFHIKYRKLILRIFTCTLFCEIQAAIGIMRRKNVH